MPMSARQTIVAPVVRAAAPDVTRDLLVLDEHLKDPLKVAAAFTISSRSLHSDRAVRTNCSARPLVCGARYGVLNDRDLIAAEYVIETVGEFLMLIADQELHWFRARRQHPRQLPRLLNYRCRVRIRRSSGQMHAAVAQLDEEEDVMWSSA